MDEYRVGDYVYFHEREQLAKHIVNDCLIYEMGGDRLTTNLTLIDLPGKKGKIISVDPEKNHYIVQLENNKTVLFFKEALDEFCRGVKSIEEIPMPKTNYHMECIDVVRVATESLNGIEAYLVGQIIDHIWRYKDKENPKDDLSAVQHYLYILISMT